MAKSAPFGSDFHEDKIESRPGDSVANEQKTGEAGQVDPPGSVADSAAPPLDATKGGKAAKKR